MCLASADMLFSEILQANYDYNEQWRLADVLQSI